MAILFQEKVDAAFIAKAQEVADKLGIELNWLMAVIELETAGTFDPAITNSLGYTGLIQFGKQAADRIGTTQDKLRQMTAVQQLDYVYKYYVIYKSKLKSYVDLYIATLFPVALGKPNDFVLQTSTLSAERVAKANPLFDLNKDSKITVGEIEQKLLNRIPSSFKDDLKKKFCPHCKSPL
ncbi:hypothetical protein ACFSKN_02110 [Mariniflexile gromovii]|uniref:Transglycosylase-like protein with SLT domain n=1 Tax=Mariniflexile gromovii TaxID=362523 RepID=A0ABS4BQU3_9FLAO|nr:hypothetical protein [Mariniflexile gromovii]MBP0902396.1 hypothetical protein [Mariniflexile gromovii]